MTFFFSKYHGTGNDFILIDDREKSFPINSKQISKLCHRRYGIGADGMIFLRSSEKGDFAMRIFNSDGSEAEMCGNGLRCLVQFLKDLGEEKSEFQIETMKKIYPCTAGDEKVSIRMGVPRIIEEKKKEFLIDVGNPHVVVFTDDLSSVSRRSNLEANLNYATLGPSNILHIRTFERGIEEETFSCGTGATACCLAASKQFGLSGLVEVIFESGEKLQFELNIENERLVDIIMSGRVCHVYSGRVGQSEKILSS